MYNKGRINIFQFEFEFSYMSQNINQPKLF